MIFIFIFLALLILPVIFIAGVYNRLQRGRVRIEETWSGIGTTLQQRNDLIPNLVETVKGYAKHESETLNEITRWRNQSVAATSPDQQNALQPGLGRALGNVFAVAENYPDLKADSHFMSLQSELAALEEKINNARGVYNRAASDYNAQLAVFPNNMIAGFFTMKPAAFFAEEEAARTVPKVKFN